MAFTYVHACTPRRVQSSRIPRLDALAITIGGDSHRDKATDLETHVIHVSYEFVLNEIKCKDVTRALGRKS